MNVGETFEPLTAVTGKASIPCCDRCGSPLPAGILSGHCARCLVSTSIGLTEGDVEKQSDARLVFMRSIGDYELLEEIARGGMGVVYRARQRSLNRVVALKMLLAGEFASADFVRRFRKEAEAAASLRHPNIVSIHEVGQGDGQHYFSMEFVEGRNLADLVRNGPLSANRAAGYLKIITEAVAFAHDHGIIHRDLKPSNILIDAFDQPRITDFGLARQLQSEDHLTLSGQALGSPAYMAPEQAAGGMVGPAADIYSLGALLYHLISGRPPFQGDTLAETMRQAREDEPVPPKRFSPGIPQDLQTICLKCLEKDPARRYSAAAELADDLKRFLDGEPIRARPPSPIGKLWLWSRRRPAIAGLIASVAALLIVVAVGSSAAAWRISLARRGEYRANQDLRASNTRLGETVGLLELEQAEELFRNEDSAAGVAHLAAMLRRDPSNEIAAARLISALAHRDWALRLGPPIRHGNEAVMVSLSADEQQVLTQGKDAEVKAWNCKTGGLLFSLPHAARVIVAQYSPDGSRILTASEDGTARIWSPTNGKLLGAPLRHEGKLRWAEFSTDGQRVLTAGDFGVKVWAAKTGQVNLIFPTGAGEVLKARFSVDGNRIVAVTGSGTIQVWSVDAGSFEFELKGHRGRINSLAFSLDGLRIAAGGDGAAWLWNTIAASSAPLTLPHSPWAPVWRVTFSPDSRALLTTAEDSAARLWDSNTGFPIGQPLSHEGGVVYGAFSRDGNRVVTTSADISARVWDWRVGKPISQPLRHHEPVRYAAFSANGQQLLTGSDDGTVQRWDVQPRHAQPIEIRHTEAVTTAEFNPRDGSLFTASMDRAAAFWNPQNGQTIGTAITQDAPIVSGVLSKDGSMAVIGCANGAGYVLEVPTRRVIAGPAWHSNSISFVRFSRNAKKFVAASTDGSARVWDAQTARPMTPPLQHSNAVLMASFSADGLRVVTASEDWTARVWDAQSGAQLVEPLRHKDHVRWAEFSPDGKKILTASTDNTAAIWDAKSGRLAAPLLQHARIVEMASFSPDGSKVVTASQDRTARIWDANTGLALTPPLRHLSAVSHVKFSPDGRRILTGGWNSQVRIWDATTGRPLTEWLVAGGGKITALAFDSSGHRMATAGDNGLTRVWNTPAPSVPVPTWFPELAEAVAGMRVGTRGNVELISDPELDSTARQFDQRSSNDFYGRFAQWFLADPATRPADPF